MTVYIAFFSSFPANVAVFYASGYEVGDKEGKNEREETNITSRFILFPPHLLRCVPLTPGLLAGRPVLIFFS